MRSYRQRLYDTYASRGREEVPRFDRAAATRRADYLGAVFADWLPQDRTAAIADLGCGSGEALFALQRLGYSSLTGVDVSREQVELASSALGLEIELGEAGAFLDRHPAGFDLLLALDVLEHLDKDEALEFLDKCWNGLRPGGALIIQTPNAASPLGMTVRYGDYTHEIAFTPDSLRWVLEVVGFREPRMREAGPRAVGVGGLLRSLCWRVLWLGVYLWNVVETGSDGSGIYTRVFFATARRPD